MGEENPLWYPVLERDTQMNAMLAMEHCIDLDNQNSFAADGEYRVVKLIVLREVVE